MSDITGYEVDHFRAMRDQARDVKRIADALERLADRFCPPDPEEVES